MAAPDLPRTVDALLDLWRGGEGIAVAAELAARAKTRWLRRGRGATISAVELAAMVLTLDVYLEDHPEIGPADPPRQSDHKARDTEL